SGSVSMTTALEPLAHARLPAEYRGLGRCFRDNVRATDVRFQGALSTVTQPLCVRLARHPRLRKEQVTGAISDYRKLIPSEFRLGEITPRPDRDAFAIRECRLTATVLHSRDWVDDDPIEPGVAGEILSAIRSRQAHLRLVSDRDCFVACSGE